MIKKIIYILLILLVDLSVYIFLGLLMMNYEDFYTEEEGPWYSLESMSTSEQIVWFSYQGWIWLNILTAVYLIYRLIIKRMRII